MQCQCYKNLNAVGSFRCQHYKAKCMHAICMRCLTLPAKSVLEGMSARCCLTGLYPKGVLIIFFDHITNYT